MIWISQGWIAEKKNAKVVDLVSLGTLSGPGAPDPDLARFSTQVYCWDGMAEWMLSIRHSKMIEISLVLLTF